MTSEIAGSVESAAALYGVEAAWVDVDGRRRTAPSDVVLDVLRRLGAPVEREEDLAEAGRVRRREIWRQVCPPARACRAGEAAVVPLRLPAERSRGPVDWRLRSPGAPLRTGAGRIDDLVLTGGSTVDGRGFEIRALELPADLPVGIHELTIRHGPGEWMVHLIVAPPRTWRGPRLEGSWGLFHPLYGLRSGHDAGVGDFATLRDALERTSGWGGRVFGTTPLLAGFSEAPVDPSPYAPASRLFWDDRYVELGAVPGWAEARGAGELEMLGALGAHMADELVPWDAISRVRGEALSALSTRFFATGGDRDSDFRGWLAGRPEAADFARFMAGRIEWGGDWRKWPEPARSGRVPAGVVDVRVVRRHLFGQWQAARQLERLGDGPAGSSAAVLYLDVPLGAHPDGYDAWRHRELFVDGVAAGAPPDDFFRGGQDWGLPPLHPERIRENGFAHVAAALRHAMGPAGLVRIDHVMQLHRLFWVPAGARPADGVYVRYPAEELAAVVAVESARARCEVSGEDLGTVPDAVRELMDRRGIRRSAVLGFELDEAADGGAEGDPAAAVPAGAVATVETHDMVPLAGLRHAYDLEERARLNLVDPVEFERLRARRESAFANLERRYGIGRQPGVRPAVCADEPDPLLAPLLAALGGSRAGIVLVPLDDLFGVRRPQNVPGTRAERPNWRRRLPAPLADGLPETAGRALAELAEAREAASSQSRAGSDAA
ncbi:MAG: 4-alpha-glucanotransferase [Gemmatimonadales bacterium]|jgi:4-alpha-glucanotransferase